MTCIPYGRTQVTGLDILAALEVSTAVTLHLMDDGSPPRASDFSTAYAFYPGPDSASVLALRLTVHHVLRILTTPVSFLEY
jgi:hypothetical protein